MDDLGMSGSGYAADDISEDHPGATDNYDRVQEAAEPRKMYGTTPPPQFVTPERGVWALGMSAVGDPVFNMDGMNNDEFYTYDSDLPLGDDD